MKQRDTSRIIVSILCIVFVISVIIISFVFRKDIERYAMVSYLGVFVACVASTATILLPAPGILVVIRYAQIFNPVLVILLGGIGTAIGELIGYVFGWSGNEMLRIDSKGKIFSWFSSHPNLMVFLFSVIPLPVFDIVGISAGATKMNPFRFLGLCIVGKTIKMAVFVLLAKYILDLFPSLLA